MAMNSVLIESMVRSLKRIGYWVLKPHRVRAAHTTVTADLLELESYEDQTELRRMMQDKAVDELAFFLQIQAL